LLKILFFVQIFIFNEFHSNFMCVGSHCTPHIQLLYSQTSVHELNSFLKVVHKPELFSP